MKVVVGISGGVDSSVAALLLKKQGHEIIGLFMRNWDSTLNQDILGNPNLNNLICPQEKDYNDALQVCEKLNIPLHRVDFTKEYWDYVFSYFLDELKANRTPNPDVMCNRYIKFDLFINEAKKLGAEAIATGHYARFENNQLLKAIDKNKDQSYFLAQVPLKQFQNILFPLGNLNKKEVRDIAKENNLFVANKKDSTGICFIGERNFSQFLENYLPLKPGKIVKLETNKVIGDHRGLAYYTIGQRRGLKVGGTKNRLFVVSKDLEKNILYVTEKEENLYSDEATIIKMNWLAKIPKKCMAKFRYRQKDNPVEIISIKKDEIRIKYNNVKAVTPGQICVLYDGELCLGSGIINQVFYQGKTKNV